MRKLLIITLSGIVLVSSGCLKDTPATDLSHAGTIIEMIYPPAASNNGVGTGLEYFSGGTLVFPPTDISDTVTYYVNIAGTNTLSKTLHVTIAVDPGSLQDNYTSDSITYSVMPDSDYTILKKAGTIPAGSRMDTFQVVFYPYKFDLTKNYGLPLVLSAPGYTVSGNFGKLYFHTIGNPIAGSYTQEWIRYNNAAGTGTPTYDQTFPAIFAPVNPTTINVTSGSAGLIYVLSFTNSGGVLSNFQVSFDATSVKNSGVTITGGPWIIVANPGAHKYQFNFTYNNSAGSPRNITDKFY